LTVPEGEVSAVPVIETRNLVKRYGVIEALKGVSLSVEPGEIYGLLGQNGAGKTTLIKILLGIAKKTNGTAHLLELPVGTTFVRRRVGYLPEDHRFPEYHSGYSLMDFYGSLLGVSRSARRRRIPEMLELVGLKGRMNSKIRTYSKGMKQRLGIAQSLLHDPEVIFLDEPTDGVDPVGRREIRALMQRLKRDGKTIFLNSHLLGEVELICDRVGILQRGEMICEGDIATLTKVRGLFSVGLGPGQAFPLDEVRRLGYDVQPKGPHVEVGLLDGQTIDPVIRFLFERGLSLRHLVEKRQSLEELFLATVTDSEPGVDKNPT
jgi:ABC-2 type transport system ATP-binding protein